MNNTDALKQTKVQRRYLLNQIIKSIEADETRDKFDKLVPWSEIGSIERQCDMLKKLLNELNDQRKPT